MVMVKVLLAAAGGLNAAFVLFHIFLGYQIWRWTGLPLPMRGLLETFNAGGALMILFLAYALLARGREVLTTGLGAAVLMLGTILYLSRAAEEFIWLNGNLKIAGICTVVGLLHAALLTCVRKNPKTA
jgi:hypothetical protein